MSSRRFTPCAALILGLLGCGGLAFRDQAAPMTYLAIGGSYFIVGLVIMLLRNPIASWWSSSTLLPWGCAVLLLLAGVNALSRVKWSQTTTIYTNSKMAPKQNASPGMTSGGLPMASLAN